MRKVEEPTFHARSGAIFKSAAEAAKDDAYHIFKNSFDGEEVSPHQFAHKWREVYRALHILNEELDAASAPPVSFDTGAVPR